MKTKYLLLLIGIFSLVFSGKAQNPCGNGTIILNGTTIDAISFDNNDSQGLKLPIWLPAGSTIEPGNRVYAINVIEFNILGTPGNNHSLEYNASIVITSSQTVPANKTWKVESIIKYSNPFGTGLTASSNFPICFDGNLNLTSSVSGATYSWTGPNGFTSSVQNPTINNVDNTNAGMYYLTATHQGCSYTDSINIVVNPLPASTFTNTAAVENFPSTFTPTASGLSYVWTFPSGTPPTSTVENPQVTWTTANNYNVSLTVTDGIGCSSTTQQSVTVSPALSGGSTTFNYTGAAQNFTVPAGVTTLNIEAWGADGGNALNGIGGKGGYSKGDLTVIPGSTYYIYVGGRGISASTPVNGGWNGGGGFTGTFSAGLDGGTGGGGSDIRTTQNASYANRVIVAGGGGGACGYNTFNGDGGNGGGNTGMDGTSSRGVTYAGGGGTQSAGGTAATGGIGGYSSPGTFGVGGDYTGTLGGTAGGGGYYGGGSGHWGGAGGGGSSYIGGVTNALTAQSGQSGFVPNPDLSGNGRVIISW